MRLLTIVLSAATLWAAVPAAASEETQGEIRHEAHPLERYREVVARPLFSPSRRASAAEAVSAEPADVPVLQGVVLARDKKIALVAYGTPAIARRVSENQEVGVWKIEKILKDQVVLRASDGKAATIRLKAARSDDAANTGPRR